MVHRPVDGSVSRPLQQADAAPAAPDTSQLSVSTAPQPGYVPASRQAQLPKACLKFSE